MKYQYVSRKCTVRQDVRDYTEKKLSKLDKFFDDECTMHIIYTFEKEDQFKVEATASYNGMIFRAQAVDTDFKYCIDDIVDTLIRQIRKHKTKLQNQLKKSYIDLGPNDNEIKESDDILVKKKLFSVKPMSTDEAILQMNMLGHDFFIFKNEGLNVCVVYRRKDGNYGLIEAD